jgi:hypothetical protein
LDWSHANCKICRKCKRKIYISWYWLEKYIPEKANETKKFWSGDKTDKTKDYWNWTDEQFETWLIKKIGEEEAKKLLDEGINQTFLSKLTETNLKLMGLKFNSIFLLLDEIKNLLE